VNRTAAIRVFFLRELSLYGRYVVWVVPSGSLEGPDLSDGVEAANAESGEKAGSTVSLAYSSAQKTFSALLKSHPNASTENFVCFSRF
jgi:hypothetical protein